MWAYLAILLVGFWLGVAIFLYISFYWLDEILDLPPLRNGSQSSASSRPSSGASNAHAHLKRLVARVVEEASALPALARYAAEPHTPTIESSTYEDLLASAILNKVIERFQNENGSGGRSSGIHSASASPTPSERSSPRSLTSRNTRDITPPLHEEDDVSDWEEGEATDEAVEVPRRVPFPEFGGDIVHADDNEERRSLDEASSSDLQGIDGTWEENWLFQKKRIKTIQSVPVPMLVPNSNTDYRALIGDRDADDTTDLSDNASDTEEQAEYKSDIKKVLDSKHVIGGKIKLDNESDYEPDSLTMDDRADHIDKLVKNGYKNDITVNASINEINDIVTVAKTHDTNSLDVIDGNDSVLRVGIDDGPLPKAEFNLKEEIHRTLMNGNATHYSKDHHENEEVFDDSIESITNSKDKGNESTTSTLNHHEREGEYEETVTVPVQRYADSLRRKHFEDTNLELHTEIDDIQGEDELVPGSVADRERKKWLNCVDMPNNPYSPEAIQKRLLAKSTSSLFDMITKNQDFDEEQQTSQKLVNGDDKNYKEESDTGPRKISASISTDNVSIDRRSKSPSPRLLKEVLADEVPQYKRYGRDYYVKEAKASAGGRKKNSFSDTSSLSSMNKSTSLDNFDTEFATPVSASSSLSDLEACALHQNISRAVLSPRHASPNFAINPIFEQPDKQNDTTDEYHAKERYVDRKPNVRESRNLCNEGDGYVENEDIVRLKIPNKPEITEDLFETYTNVRRNNTLRGEDHYARAKRRPGLNFTFGGSLRDYL